MKSNKPVELSIDGNGVATILLNRPDINNAFDDLMISELTEMLYKIDKNTNIRLVLLKGAGKSFSAGADLNWMKRMAHYNWNENFQDSLALASLLSALHGLTQPIIAVVQGSAYGGGVGLIAACDFAIASNKAKFCLSEVKLGLIPAVISPYVVRAMGERASKRYFISAETFDAYKAFELGLVSEVVPHSDLDTVVENMVQQIIANGPIAIAEAKKLIDKVSLGDINEEMIRDTAQKIADLRSSPEGKEGVSAFLEKRRPVWPDKESIVTDLAEVSDDELE